MKAREAMRDVTNTEERIARVVKYHKKFGIMWLREEDIALLPKSYLMQILPIEMSSIWYKLPKSMRDDRDLIKRAGLCSEHCFPQMDDRMMVDDDDDDDDDYKDDNLMGHCPTCVKTCDRKKINNL
jgi:hypothetical protein